MYVIRQSWCIHNGEMINQSSQDLHITKLCGLQEAQF